MKTCLKCKKNYSQIFSFCSIDGHSLFEDFFLESKTQDLSGKLETINLSQLPFSQSFTPPMAMSSRRVYIALATMFCSTVFLCGSLIGVMTMALSK